MSKTLPPGLQTHLDGGTSNMVYCWRVTRSKPSWLTYDNCFDELTYEPYPGDTPAGVLESSAITWKTYTLPLPLTTKKTYEIENAANYTVYKSFNITNLNLDMADIDIEDITLDVSIHVEWKLAGPSLRLRIFGLPATGAGGPDYSFPHAFHGEFIDEKVVSASGDSDSTLTATGVIPAGSRWIQVQLIGIDGFKAEFLDFEFKVRGLRAYTVQGFTEHDKNLTFDGTEFIASSGFTATTITSELGLNVDNMNVDGALSDDTINERDLASGAYDDAEVELFWVNFSDVSQRILQTKGSIGEVQRGDFAFSAELRSQTHRLQQRTGRTYQLYCDADLGDDRCRVPDTCAAYSSEGVVTSSIGDRVLTISGLTNNVKDFYKLGKLVFLSGDNAADAVSIKEHIQDGSDAIISLWSVLPFSIAATDKVFLIAGCEKDIDTCKEKFGNVLNFRGFPFIPGNDFISKYAEKGGADQDGGSNN